MTPMRTRRRRRYSFKAFAASMLEGAARSAPRLSRFTPGKDAVLTAQEAGWASGPVWTGTENLAPTGIRSLGRPSRNESLYRLRYMM